MDETDKLPIMDKEMEKEIDRQIKKEDKEREEAIKATQAHTDFIHRCGQIIRKGFSAENMLNHFLYNYFSYPQSRRSFLLNELVISKLGFKKKIELFRIICKQENVDKTKIKELSTAFDFIKEKRDIVAHHEAYVASPYKYEIRLKKIAYSWSDKDLKEVSEKTVKEVNEKLNLLLRHIWKLEKEIIENFNRVQLV